MKIIIKSLLTTTLFFVTMQLVSAQTTIKNTPLGNQFKLIFANAPSGYKKLRAGIDAVNSADTVFISSLKIPGTQKSTISVDSYSKTYIILVAEDLADSVAQKTFDKWSSDIHNALGTDFIASNDVKTEDGYISITDIYIYRDPKFKKKIVRVRMSTYENYPATIDIIVSVD